MLCVAFYKGSGKFWDRMVRWWTDSPFSHSELLFSDGSYFSADAWTNKVRYTKFQPNPDNWVVVPLYCVDEKMEQRVRWFCNGIEGSKYDYLGVALSQVIPLGIQVGDRWFCSELCTRALQQVGLLRWYQPWSMSPGKLYDRLNYK